jgi:hypothetical protein
MSVDVTYVSPDYFKTLNIPLSSGRDFNAQDAIGSPPVVIINEKMSQYFFPGQNPSENGSAWTSFRTGRLSA